MNYETRESGDALVFELHGSLRGQPTGYKVLEAVREEIKAGKKKIVIDLGEVNDSDSTGLGILASIITSAEGGGAKVGFTSPPASLKKLLDIVRLSTVMKIFPSVDEAAAGI